MLWFSSYVIVFEFSWKVKERKNRRHYLLTDPRIIQDSPANAVLLCNPPKQSVLCTFYYHASLFHSLCHFFFTSCFPWSVSVHSIKRFIFIYLVQSSSFPSIIIIRWTNNNSLRSNLIALSSVSIFCLISWSVISYFLETPITPPK